MSFVIMMTMGIVFFMVATSTLFVRAELNRQRNGDRDDPFEL